MPARSRSSGRREFAQATGAPYKNGMTFKTLAFALAVSAPLLHAPLSVACTALMITDLRGNAYSGKTMEFAGLLPFEMTYVPAGTPVTSKAPDGRPGLSFATRYPVLGVSANLRDGSRLNKMIEAANANGGNDYYESAVAQPDAVLADLIAIFHPALLPDHEFVYYQRLQ